MLSGHSHDIFAVDIYYHRSGYIKYALSPIATQEYDKEREEREKDVLNSFDYQVKIKIICDKEASLLNELLEDVENISEEQHVSPPVFNYMKSLKRHLIQQFDEEIGVFPSRKYLLVHAKDVNPSTYSIATLHGYGLRDENLALSFGRMLRRKLMFNMEETNKWPQTPKESMATLDKGPLPDLCKEKRVRLRNYRNANCNENLVTSK